MPEKEEVRTKTRKKKKNWAAIWLMVGMVILIAAVTFIAAGANLGWWGDEVAPSERWQPRNDVLSVLYKNPGETFQVEMPAEPSVINVDYSGFPMMNYYAIDQATGDGYTVSQVRDVESIFGVDGRAFLVWVGEEFIKTLSEDSSAGSEYMMLKNEMVGNTREVEAQVYNAENGDYVRYKLIGRENQLMILKAEGKMERVKNYEDFMKSFVWLSLENADVDVQLPMMSPEEMLDLASGQEKPKAALEEGMVLVRQASDGAVVAIPESEVREGDTVIEVERL